MKCDELKAIKQGSVELGEYWVYDADDVDAAIAELKQKLEGAKNETNYWCNNLKVFAQKKDSEIAELKNKLEYAGMRERRLKRALWLARAQRANEHYHRYHGKFLCPLEDIPEYVKWKQVESKCLKKAEEYK